MLSGLLCGTGDLLAQQGLESKGLAAHDFQRTGRMVFFGTFFVGPAISNWYKLLHRHVTFKNPIQGALRPFSMSCIDQKFKQMQLSLLGLPLISFYSPQVLLASFSWSQGLWRAMRFKTRGRNLRASTGARSRQTITCGLRFKSLIFTWCQCTTRAS